MSTHAFCIVLVKTKKQQHPGIKLLQLFLEMMDEGQIGAELSSKNDNISVCSPLIKLKSKAAVLCFISLLLGTAIA
jgi:hypothetical protein